MDSRILSALTLIVMLSVVAAGSAIADGIVVYEDTEGTADFPHDAPKGPVVVPNGAFDDWTADSPVSWTLDASGASAPGHFAKVNLADPRHAPNYALGLFLRTDGAQAGGHGVAYAPLNVPAAGNYWTVVHVTAWGEGDNSVMHNSEAMYAIYPKADPSAVPASEWRELFPDAQVCPNQQEICNHLARKETRYIEPGSYIFLKGMMKFPDLHAWTVFGWDDISISPVEAGASWPHAEQTWLDEGDITWDQFATR